MKVSIIMITIDRYEILKETLDVILKNTGYDNFELCVADNGSTNKRVKEYIESLKPAVFIENGENKGVAHTLNQLIEKSTGDLICHIGNDIVMTDDWMKSLVEHQTAIPDTGVNAVYVVETLPELVEVSGKSVRLSKIVFGCKMYRKELVKDLAYKEWSKYGLEDSDLSLRFYYQGLKNYYVPNKQGFHNGRDEKANTPYRMMKWAELKKAEPHFNKSIAEYKKNDKSTY